MSPGAVPLQRDFDELLFLEKDRLLLGLTLGYTLKLPPVSYFS